MPVYVNGGYGADGKAWGAHQGQRHAYAVLTDAEFDRALAALDAAVEDSEGDVRSANFKTPR